MTLASLQADLRKDDPDLLPESRDALRYAADQLQPFVDLERQQSQREARDLELIRELLEGVEQLEKGMHDDCHGNMCAVSRARARLEEKT